MKCAFCNEEFKAGDEVAFFTIGRMRYDSKRGTRFETGDLEDFLRSLKPVHADQCFWSLIGIVDSDLRQLFVDQVLEEAGIY